MRLDNPTNPFSVDSDFQKFLADYKANPTAENPAGAALDAMGDITYGGSNSSNSGLPGFNTFATKWSQVMNGNPASFSNWVNNKYGAYWNQYNNQMARQLGNGEDSSTSWLEWLSQRNPVNEWNAATDYERGFRPADFWSRSKWTR